MLWLRKKRTAVGYITPLSGKIGILSSVTLSSVPHLDRDNETEHCGSRKQRMWHLIEDFFEQSIVVKLFIGVGWLAMGIMLASFIALLVP